MADRKLNLLRIGLATLLCALYAPISKGSPLAVETARQNVVDGNWGLAYSQASRLMEQKPLSAEVHLLMGDLAFDLGQWRRASYAYRIYLKLKPESFLKKFVISRLISLDRENEVFEKSGFDSLKEPLESRSPEKNKEDAKPLQPLLHGFQFSGLWGAPFGTVAHDFNGTKLFYNDLFSAGLGADLNYFYRMSSWPLVFRFGIQLEKLLSRNASIPIIIDPNSPAVATETPISDVLLISPYLGMGLCWRGLWIILDGGYTFPFADQLDTAVGTPAIDRIPLNPAILYAGLSLGGRHQVTDQLAFQVELRAGGPIFKSLITRFLIGTTSPSTVESEYFSSVKLLFGLQYQL